MRLYPHVFRLFLAVALALVLPQAMHATQAATTIGPDGAVAPDSALAKASAARGFDLSRIDPTCKPCQDFYRFANGGWEKSTALPADRSNYGTFTQLFDRNREVLHALLDGLAANTTSAPGSPERKVGQFYASCMNTPQRDAAGITPLRSPLDTIAAVRSLADLPVATAKLAEIGAGPLVGAFVTTDARDARAPQILGVGPGALPLGGRESYLGTTPRDTTIRDAYRAHIARVLTLAGDAPDKARTEADAVMALETAMATSLLTNVERRNPEAQVNPTTLAALNAETPAFNWTTYFQTRGLTPAKINVGQPKALAAVQTVLASTPIDTLKTEMRWVLLSAYSNTLSTPFVQENYAFEAAVTGTTQTPPLWERCADATDAALPEALGQLYIAKNFSPQAKARAEAMIANVKASLRDDIQTLSWMSPATKTQATAKLDAMSVLVGASAHPETYAGVTIVDGPFATNAIATRAAAVKRNVDELGKPLDRTRLRMSPPTVNAYYNPSANSINFPAGILQPPFFDPNADDAVNYGAMGSVMGHEMTHGFDDTGRRFDANGDLRDWWTPEDAKAFAARATCVADLYSSFKVGDRNINGRFVLGEAIADIGGAKIAYDALEKSLRGKPRRVIDGFTPEQRFFLGYAEFHARKFRPEEAARRIDTDPHPNDYYRVIGVVENMPEFAQAFGCKTGDPMVRPAAQRCAIW